MDKFDLKHFLVVLVLIKPAIKSWNKHNHGSAARMIFKKRKNNLGVAISVVLYFSKKITKLFLHYKLISIYNYGSK